MSIIHVGEDATYAGRPLFSMARMPDGSVIPFIGQVNPPGAPGQFAWRETLCEKLGATILRPVMSQRFRCRLRLGGLDYKGQYIQLIPDTPEPQSKLMDIQFNLARMKTVMEQCMAGRVKMEDDCIIGDFVLRKGGSTVFLVPYEGPLEVRPRP